MDAFAASMAAVQSHLESWQAREDGNGLRDDEEEMVAAAHEAMGAAETAVETAKEKIYAWLEKFPRPE